MQFSDIMARQRAFFQSGATQALDFRRAQLKMLACQLDAYETELLAALHADLRKSPQQAYTSEISGVQGEIRHALKHLGAWMRPQRRRTPLLAWPARSHVHPQPYGVALIMSAWNYPVQLLLAPLVGAIAAGNCAVLKPSEFAPHTAAVLDRLIRSTFSEDFLTLVTGDQKTSAALLDQKFDKIFFTGGTETGRAVMTAAARHLTPVTLELGGKCPCIVGHDAPVQITARRIVWGKFLNAGQTCVAPDHLWVDKQIAPALIQAMIAALREFYGDSPQQSPDFGRIINRRHFDRLNGYLAHGTLACGGTTDPADLYIAPTILTACASNSPVMTEEIFGPILPVMEFSDLGEVLATLRDRPPPLAVYLFTGDGALQHRVVSSTRSGGVCINDTILQILGKDLPFGGVGESGMGTYHGRASFDCFSHPRAVLHRHLTMDLGFRYPPQHIPLKWLKRLLRTLA